MNNLIKALNRVQDWFKIYRPDYATFLQPGLTRKEIEEIISSLPIQLSEEVYTLYEWHNGSDSREQFLPFYDFLPLESAIANMYYVDFEDSKYTPLLTEIDS